eukprot:166179-Hanusia_phi.AAC.4
MYCVPIPCTPYCDPGYYETAPCTITHDRQCAKCDVHVPVNSFFTVNCSFECLPGFIQWNATYCGYCNPGRACSIGYYLDDCLPSNAFTGCSRCRNGLAGGNSSFVFVTAGEPFSPFSCSWKCLPGYTLGRNSTGGLACNPPPAQPVYTPVPLGTPVASCPPGQYLSPQLDCQPCTDTLPGTFATWTQGCRWICVGGRIAVVDPVQDRLTCMLYEDYVALVEGNRRVLVQTRLNDSYVPHIVGDSMTFTLYYMCGFVALALTLARDDAVGEGGHLVWRLLTQPPLQQRYRGCVLGLRAPLPPAVGNAARHGRDERGQCDALRDEDDGHRGDVRAWQGA